MITGGIDVGIENTKAVVLQDGKVAGRASGHSGGASRGRHAEEIWQAALKAAGVSASSVTKIVATGQGKYDVGFTRDRVVEPLADARAAKFLFPQARSVVDLGADQVRVVSLDEKSGIREVALNAKCGAGVGLFLESMARTLGMSLDEMAASNGAASEPPAVSDACCVFGELDAIALIHNNTPRPQIIEAVHAAAATRINSVLNEKIKPEKSTTVLIGGLSRNPALVEALEKRSGISFLRPAEAEYAGALGAALIAAGEGV